MDDFEYANYELGELINDGEFGENVKQLTKQFGEISDDEYFCRSLDLWLQDTNQYGKENVKLFIKVFIDIISKSIDVDIQSTINEIIWFLKGDVVNERAETISSYMEYLLNHKTFIEEIQKKSSDEKSIKNAKQLANALINAYSKGIEYVSKIYSLITILFCITDKRKINIKNINRKRLYDKCNNIKSRGIPEYNILVDSIDRNIRNADAHLNIYYNVGKEVYIYKLLIKGKWKYIEVPVVDMTFDIYPKIGWIVQGFIYTVSLIIIAANDKNKYIEYINKIFVE